MVCGEDFGGGHGSALTVAGDFFRVSNRRLECAPKIVVLHTAIVAGGRARSLQGGGGARHAMVAASLHLAEDFGEGGEKGGKDVHGMSFQDGAAAR